MDLLLVAGALHGPSPRVPAGLPDHGRPAGTVPGPYASGPGRRTGAAR